MALFATRKKSRVFADVVFVCGVIIPANCLSAYIVAQIGARHATLAVIAVAVSVTVCAAMVWLRFSDDGRKTFARLAEVESLWSVAFVILAVAWATTGFVVVSAAFYKAGHGTIPGPELHGTRLVDTIYSYYLWHLAHAVPALDITETANWTLRRRFTDSFQGVLVLVYTIVMVVPFIYLAATLFGRITGSGHSEPDS